VFVISYRHNRRHIRGNPRVDLVHGRNMTGPGEAVPPMPEVPTAGIGGRTRSPGVVTGQCGNPLHVVIGCPHTARAHTRQGLDKTIPPSTMAMDEPGEKTDSQNKDGVHGVSRSWVERYADFLAETGRICAVYPYATLAITLCVCVGGATLFMATFVEEVNPLALTPSRSRS
jgi:hypothetical protein